MKLTIENAWIQSKTADILPSSTTVTVELKDCSTEAIFALYRDLSRYKHVFRERGILLDLVISEIESRWLDPDILASLHDEEN